MMKLQSYRGARSPGRQRAQRAPGRGDGSPLRRGRCPGMGGRAIGRAQDGKRGRPGAPATHGAGGKGRRSAVPGAAPARGCGSPAPPAPPSPNPRPPWRSWRLIPPVSTAAFQGEGVVPGRGIALSSEPTHPGHPLPPPARQRGCAPGALGVASGVFFSFCYAKHFASPRRCV